MVLQKKSTATCPNRDKTAPNGDLVIFSTGCHVKAASGWAESGEQQFSCRSSAYKPRVNTNGLEPLVERQARACPFIRAVLWFVSHEQCTFAKSFVPTAAKRH